MVNHNRSEPGNPSNESRTAGSGINLTQTEEAVRAMLRAFPDMTGSDALVQVNRLLRQ